MYDLQKMTLRDMSECGLALRHLGKGAKNMEDASNNIIHYLYQNLINKDSGEKSCVLIRFFKTHPYGELTPELQESTRGLLGNNVVTASLKCLTLLATAGELPEWNSRHQSMGHKAIPLANEKAIARAPMIFQLIQQLGLNPGIVVKPDPNLMTDLEQRMYNVFYVPDACGSPYIPSQTSFVIPFNIKSVVGFGGLLPSGNMFAILMFLKVAIPRMTVDLLRPVALNVKMAILPFDNGRIFSCHGQSVLNEKITTLINNNETLESHKSQISTLSQLLDVSEQCTITQSDRLEQAITDLQTTLDKLQKTQSQLIQSEKMSSLGQLVAGVAHEINNPVNFIEGNLTYTAKYTQNLLKLVQTYQRHYPDPPEEIQQLIKTIELDFLTQDLSKILNSMTVGTQRISEIVQSLRNFSRLDEAELKQVDIHQGIDSTLMILEHRLLAKDKHPEIKVVKEYGQLPLVECYPGQLNQVFMNIIANAIDALLEGVGNGEWRVGKSQPPTPYGRTDVPLSRLFPTPQIHICTELLNDNWVTITIADNGPGMNEQVRSKLFDPFFTTKPVGKGIGMGLSISYQIIVEKHRGQLSCLSTLGQGTFFAIKIPIQQ